MCNRVSGFPYLFLLWCFLGCAPLYAQQCPIIPMPRTAHPGSGHFSLNTQTRIWVETPELNHAGDYLSKEIMRYHDLLLQVHDTETRGIHLGVDSTLAREAYTLDIRSEGIEIQGGSPAGVFYGVVSLLQLVREQADSGDIRLDCWHIEDAPRYAWRGLMLDVSRHFISKGKICELLDWMAFYKLNRLHLHLSDAPAWRIEIKQYPKLTQIGARGDYADPDLPPAYYTQADIAYIVAYAAQRHITILPEIDMPGHASAANRAYPAYNGGGTPAHPDFTFDPGKPETYTYLSQILQEVNHLFPAHMIHLGGDEVSFGMEAWKQNPGITALMEAHHLPDLQAVEHYFMERMADSLRQIGARVAVWDEMAEANLPVDSTIVYWWRHDQPQQFIAALQKGYPVVACPRLPLYFDFVQDSTHHIGRKWSGDYNSLQDVYTYNLESFQHKAAAGQILGIQANLWTERIHSPEKLDFMLFPRIAALAEMTWTVSGKKDFLRFEENLKQHLIYYQNEGIYYYDPFANTHAEPDDRERPPKYPY